MELAYSNRAKDGKCQVRKSEGCFRKAIPIIEVADTAQSQHTPQGQPNRPTQRGHQQDTEDVDGFLTDTEAAITVAGYKVPIMGTNVNAGAGFINQPTNTFIIKGKV